MSITSSIKARNGSMACFTVDAVAPAGEKMSVCNHGRCNELLASCECYPGWIGSADFTTHDMRPWGGVVLNCHINLQATQILWAICLCCQLLSAWAVYGGRGKHNAIRTQFLEFKKKRATAAQRGQNKFKRWWDHRPLLVLLVLYPLYYMGSLYTMAAKLASPAGSLVGIHEDVTIAFILSNVCLQINDFWEAPRNAHKMKKMSDSLRKLVPEFIGAAPRSPRRSVSPSSPTASPTSSSRSTSLTRRISATTRNAQNVVTDIAQRRSRALLRILITRFSLLATIQCGLQTFVVLSCVVPGFIFSPGLQVASTSDDIQDSQGLHPSTAQSRLNLSTAKLKEMQSIQIPWLYALGFSFLVGALLRAAFLFLFDITIGKAIALAQAKDSGPPGSFLQVSSMQILRAVRRRRRHVRIDFGACSIGYLLLGSGFVAAASDPTITGPVATYFILPVSFMLGAAVIFMAGRVMKFSRQQMTNQGLSRVQSMRQAGLTSNIARTFSFTNSENSSNHTSTDVGPSRMTPSRTFPSPLTPTWARTTSNSDASFEPSTPRSPRQAWSP